MAETVKPVEGVATSSNSFDDIFVAMLGAVNYNPATMAPLRYNPWGRNTLAVTGTATPVSVATGDAIVNGKHYTNTAAKNIAVGTPAAATRIDRVVLRIDYTVSPYTCTAELLAGAEGGAAPALTQTDGTTWEVSLAQVSITTGGVITVTDERVYVGELNTSNMADRVRYVFVPAQGVYNTTDGSVISRSDGRGYVMPDAKTCSAFVSYLVPTDYASGGTLYGLCIPAASGDLRIGTWQADFGSFFSEAYNTHSVNDTDSTVAGLTASAVEAPSGLTLTGVAVGDTISATWQRAGAHADDTIGDSVYFVGFLFYYTADM